MAKDKSFTGIIPHKINYKGETFLGIPTGITSKSFSLTKIITIKNRPGWIVRGDSIEEWKIAGFCQYEEETFLYGPFAEGRSLEELLTMEIYEFLPFFYSLVSSVSVLANYLRDEYSKNHPDQEAPLFRILTHSVFFLNDGGILFLPPDIMKELMELRPLEDKIRFFSVCNHPDRMGEKNLSFSIGVFLYRVMTGNFPFLSENLKDLHHMIRELSIPSPRIVRPGLKKEVLQLMSDSLDKSSPDIPLLKTWENSVKTWIDEGIEQEISEEERRIVKETEKQKKEKADKLFQFKVFLNTNLAKIAIISIVVIIIGFTAGFTIKNIFFRTRVTDGLSPYEVIQTYFNSINSLDYSTLSDCVIKDAGKSELQVVVNLYVLTRQMVAYGDPVPFISAKEWDKKGRPALALYTPMYGMIDIKTQQKRDEPEPIFLVSYEKWYTETENTNQEITGGTINYYGSAITEQFYLKKERNAWVIYRIEELEWEVLSPKAAD
ncbi:MAG: hypothetical protein JXB88_01980 [Spirochaetales bacterium]|nr:hypothetical protein [Spirochaetales bacterium]